MSSLATLADSNLDPQTAYAQLKSVEEFVQSIDSVNLLVEVIDRAKLAQEWLKVKNAAAEVVLQAARVQLAALRRIGQLGSAAIELLPDNTAERRYAARLAELTDARFEGELDSLERPVKASTFIQNIDSAHSYANWMNKGYDVADGRPADERELWARAREAEEAERAARPQKKLTKKQLERREQRQRESEKWKRRENDNRVNLLSQLLEQLYQEGDPFSVSDATDQMIEALADHDMLDFGDPRTSQCVEVAMVRDGVQAAIRHALMDSASLDDAGHESIYVPSIQSEVHPPKFVTYQDPDAGWVRIPWHKAGLTQLQEMAALRRKQVADLSAKATQLTELVSLLERASERQPHEQKVSELFRNAKRTRECRGDAA
ncbi:hypothetical protein ACRYGU_16775 [Mycobacteroides abscessus]